MNYVRVALLDALNTVKPALAAKDLIEELTHVWFDGQTLVAYNDADLGISVPFKTDFSGGVRGSLLLGLLHNSRAKEVQLEPGDDGQLKLVAARTRGKLSVLDAERSVWQFPPVSTKDSFEITKDFLRALKAVLVSVGNDTSIPEKLGVTVVSDGGVRMYATDSKSIATVKVAAPKGKWLKRGQRVVLPTAFCEQVLRLCADGGFMEIAADAAIAGNADGVLVYARLVDCPHPLDFAGVFAQQMGLPEGAEFEVPTKLALALDRAIVLLDGVVGESVSLSIAGGKLRLEATVEGRGNIKDFITVPDDAPDMAILVDPVMIKRALPYAATLAVTESAVMLAGPDDFVYLVSAKGG